MGEHENGYLLGGREDGPRLYVASSWRNDQYPMVLAALRGVASDIYDFRNPEAAFDWKEIDPDWDGGPISEERYRRLVEHPRAVEGFNADMDALRSADVVVLANPCGASAHLEAGWAAGAGKPLYVLIQPEQRPDLMYRMAELVTPHLHEIVMALLPQEVAA